MKNNFVVSFLLFIIFLSFISCNSPVVDRAGTHTVRYEISGPQVIADIINYTNETGILEAIPNVLIPWEKTIIVQGRLVVSCIAIYSNIGGSTYTARIFVDGREIAKANSSSVSVTVSGVTQ